MQLLKGDRPSIFLSEKVNEKHIEIANTFNASLIISDITFEGLSEQTEKVIQTGFKDIILNLCRITSAAIFRTIRFFAGVPLRKITNPLAFPYSR